MKPPVFMKAGDTMRLGISGLGEQAQKVVPYNDAMGQAWNRGEGLKI